MARNKIGKISSSKTGEIWLQSLAHILVSVKEDKEAIVIPDFGSLISHGQKALCTHDDY